MATIRSGRNGDSMYNQSSYAGRSNNYNYNNYTPPPTFHSVIPIENSVVQGLFVGIVTYFQSQQSDNLSPFARTARTAGRAMLLIEVIGLVCEVVKIIFGSRSKYEKIKPEDVKIMMLIGRFRYHSWQLIISFEKKLDAVDEYCSQVLNLRTTEQLSKINKGMWGKIEIVRMAISNQWKTTIKSQFPQPGGYNMLIFKSMIGVFNNINNIIYEIEEEKFEAINKEKEREAKAKAETEAGAQAEAEAGAQAETEPSPSTDSTTEMGFMYTKEQNEAKGRWHRRNKVANL